MFFGSETSIHGCGSDTSLPVGEADEEDHEVRDSRGGADGTDSGVMLSS